jgi:peroxiredoxin
MSNANEGKRLFRYLIAIPLIILFGCFIFFYIKNSPQRTTTSNSTPLTVGNIAPDFSLPNLAGETVTLSSLRGKVVLLNIWATWCPTCLEEMPQLQQLYKDFKDHDDFQLLTISIDALGAQVVKPFLRKHGLDLPTLLDPKGSIKKLYRTTGVPESFIINQEGIIIDKIIGPRDWTSTTMKGFLLDIVKRGKNSFPPS